MRSIRLEERLRGVDLLVTGEGRLDSQSLRGKAAAGAGRLARSMGVRAVALVGLLGDGWEEARAGAFDVIRVVTPPGMDADEAIGRAGDLLADAAEALLQD
jgi:glycerate kinase